MPFNEDSSAAAEYLRKAVPLMVAREIPTTPYNYALWYSHVKGKNSQLSDVLLKEFPSAGSYNSKKGEKLFYEYFVKNYLPENDKAQDALVSMLTQLFGSVNKAAEGTSKFGESVQDAMTRVQETGDPEVIRNTLTGLLKDTDAVEQLTKDFQSELEAAKQEVEALKEKLVTTEQNALLDELTQIGNRRAFDQGLEESLSDTRQPTCLLLMDLDHFKKCNDTYGHVMGDKILEATGRMLMPRETETVQVARYGGEEFAVIVDGEVEEACELAEKIRRSIEAIRIKQKNCGSVIDSITASIGVAKAEANEDSKSLKERADKALYVAKEQGRNRVVLDEVLEPA
jgi:diguanylate cyclase